MTTPWVAMKRDGNGGYTAMNGRATIKPATDSSAGRGKSTKCGWILTLDGQQTPYATLNLVRERLTAEMAYETANGRVDT